MAMAVAGPFYYDGRFIALASGIAFAIFRKASTG